MNQHLKLKLSASLLGLTIISVQSANATWTLIENFDDGEFPEGTVINNTNTLIDGEHRITEDPLDPSNMVDRIVVDQTSGLTNVGNFLDFHFPLETPIEDGTIATFYHRVMAEGPENENDFDGPFGFFDASYGFVDTVYNGFNWGYGDFEAQLGYSTLTNLNWVIRNSDETGELAPWTPIWQNSNPLTDLNVWYEIWVVIDHSSDTSDVYIRGGSAFPEQTMVVENARFRNGGSTDPLGYFVMKSHNGSEDTASGYRGIDPWYLDDLYIDYTGENLSTPGESSGTGWLEDEELGWIYSFGGNWYYSFTFGYIYETGNYFFSLNHGWMSALGPLESGAYFYSIEYGYVWVAPSNGGFFQTIDGTWYNFFEAPSGS